MKLDHRMEILIFQREIEKSFVELLTIIEIDEANLQETEESTGQIEENVADTPADGRFTLVVVVGLRRRR